MIDKRYILKVKQEEEEGGSTEGSVVEDEDPVLTYEEVDQEEVISSVRDFAFMPMD